MTKTVRIKVSGEPAAYRIAIGSGLLGGCGQWAKSCLSSKTQKILIVSNKKVFGLYGAEVRKSLEKAGFKVAFWLMADGEKHKDLKSLAKLLAHLSELKFTRSDAIVALGGGVAGDLAGFAASVYLRGIAVLQVPTTLVSQIDSSVGGKTGINSDFGKNLIGTFYQPSGVLIDVDVLKTLPRRELTAGFCEVIKQGAISGKILFASAASFLKNYPVTQFAAFFADKNRESFTSELINLIEAQVSFKARIVSGDQKESPDRQDAKSRKILNFGHTVGHALEKVTNYRTLKHGEAVGYGMLAAAEIGKSLDIFDRNGLTLLLDAVRSAGKLPKLAGIKADDVYRAIAFDKKSSSGSITWILLNNIGEPALISGETIPASTIKQSIKTILK